MIAGDAYRVGYGYDIHRLVEGRRLVLGGVALDHHLGLEGHSDADVLVHAIMDALLGAAGLGDIGHHFPSTDPRWKDASSLELLRIVARLVGAAGYAVVNVDAMVVAEAPRIGPRVREMQQQIASKLAVDQACISVKATTAEGLGPEGRQEGISARAIVLISVA